MASGNSKDVTVPEIEIKKPDENSSFADWANYILAEMKKSDTAANTKLDAINGKMDKLTRDTEQTVNKCTASIAKLIHENNHLREKHNELQEKVIKLEYYTRRNNLRFDGFDEQTGETDRDCYNKIQRAIANLYDDDEEQNEAGEPVGETAYMKARRVDIPRIHRYGKYSPNRKRAIIVNLQYYSDREYIMSNRENLPPGIYVNEDFPPEIDQRRQILHPILKQALKLQKYRGKAKLKYDKLIINGIEYSMANLDQLPADIHPEDSCHRSDSDKDVMAFFGMHSPFSNFHRSPFKENGESYTCAEQYIQADKAKSFNDDATLS